METNSTILGRDDLLSGGHLEKRLVPVPELGGSLWLRELGAPQVLLFDERVKKLSNGDEKKEVDAIMAIDLMAYALSLSACDENGNLLFTEDDVQKLTENKLDVLARLSTLSLEMSGLKLLGKSLRSEVSANLKNVQATSLSSSLPTNSRKRKRK